MPRKKKTDLAKMTRRARYAAAARRKYYENRRNNLMTACDVKVCRICFVTNCMLYLLPAHKMLRQAYEELTGLMLENENHLPPYVCDQCSCQLLNCARFKTRSLQSHLILLEVIKKHHCITLDSIQSITRVQNTLSSKVTHNESDQYDVDIELVKQEDMTSGCDVDIEQGEQADTRCGFEELILVDEIKKEKDDEFNPDVNENEEFIQVEDDVFNQGMVNGQSTSGITIEVVKVENNLMDWKIINENTNFVGNKIEIDKLKKDISNATNNKISCKSMRQGHIVVDDFKIADVDMINYNNVSKEMTNDPKMRNKAFVGEHCVSEKSPCGNQGREPSNTRVQEAAKVPGDEIHTKVETLQKHTADGGLANEEYTCDMCPYKSISAVQLLSHIKAHSSTSSYICNVWCNYKTISKKNMASLNREHSGEKPYSCNVCNRGFIRKADLHLHTGERPFLCDVCDKAFHRKSDVQNHLRIHSREKLYSCDVCNKTCNGKADLQIHLRTHTGEKPYSCVVCTKAFSRNSDLQRHLRIHTIERPHVCTVCNKAYNKMGDLRNHLRTHNDDKPRIQKGAYKIYT